MRIAIVGSGVSGLVAAHLLHREHDITVFEAGARVGGHVLTAEVPVGEHTVSVDMGFIVYNELNYPNFTTLLRSLGVRTQPSSMSFSVRLAEPALEFNGSTTRQLFVQRRNLVRPWFYRMLADIVRFNRRAPEAIRNGAAHATLGEYVRSAGYSSGFVNCYLVPMGAAVWSSPEAQVLEMPAAFFIRFFEQHGMLTINDRPEWRVVAGGSARYVERLTAPFRDRIHLRTPVHEVRRHGDHVTVNGEAFDHVVLACHSDQALEALADPTPTERAVLGAIPYQRNEAVLHTDAAVLPSRVRAWAAWNAHPTSTRAAPMAITYNMNILQSLETADPLCVTLNATESIDPDRVIETVPFAHPVFTPAAVRAQRRHAEINGVARTHFCGAYWGNGFHEDGVNSALAVCRAFGAAL